MEDEDDCICDCNCGGTDWGCFLFLLGVAVIIMAGAFAGYLGRQ